LGEERFNPSSLTEVYAYKDDGQVLQMKLMNSNSLKLTTAFALLI